MADGVETDMSFRNAVRFGIRRGEMVVDGREDRLSMWVSQDRFIHTSTSGQSQASRLLSTRPDSRYKNDTSRPSDIKTTTLSLSLSACLVQEVRWTTKKKTKTTTSAPRVPAMPHGHELPQEAISSTHPPGFVVLCLFHDFP